VLNVGKCEGLTLGPHPPLEGLHAGTGVTFRGPADTIRHVGVLLTKGWIPPSLLAGQRRCSSLRRGRSLSRVRGEGIDDSQVAEDIVTNPGFPRKSLRGWGPRSGCQLVVPPRAGGDAVSGAGSGGRICAGVVSLSCNFTCIKKIQRPGTNAVWVASTTRPRAGATLRVMALAMILVIHVIL
jgi:hypothetical protein